MILQIYECMYPRISYLSPNNLLEFLYSLNKSVIYTLCQSFLAVLLVLGERKCTQTFCTALDFLQLHRLLEVEQVMLLQDWIHHYRSYGRHNEFKDRYGESICTLRTDLFNVTIIVFPSTFVYAGLDCLWAIRGESRGHLPFRFRSSGVRAAHLRLFVCT